MVERPIGERVAALEQDNAICAQDRRDIWEAVNELRPVAPRLDAIDEKLERIEGLCGAKEARIIAIEKREAVSDYQRNAIIGLAGFVAAGLGGVAIWVAREFLWPVIRKALALD